MLKRVAALAIVLLSAVCCSRQTAPQVLCIDKDWKFSLSDDPEASSRGYDDRAWRTVDLPHDWSIEGAYSADEPMGTAGGYLPAGIGWYRKHLDIPEDFLKASALLLEFEGVYMDSEVYVNGEHVTTHPYGYSSFTCDITPYLVGGGRDVIAVRVDNSKEPNCRWYSGSGIYRHVRLLAFGQVYAGYQDISVTTAELKDDSAILCAVAYVYNSTEENRTAGVNLTVKDGEGRTVASSKATCSVSPFGAEPVVREFNVAHPSLWSPEHPAMYTLEAEVEGVVTEVPFGIRTIAWSADEGFLLNGEPYTVNGGCIHHDNGILGAAAYDDAEWRKVRLLKDAGFNAVRTSHNPPAPAFLDACDRLGLLVIDEFFDGWAASKTRYGYHSYFSEWSETDAISTVLRDRNHPSVIAWSIGNEIIERKSAEAVQIADRLAYDIHQIDRQRPVTQALASWDPDWEIYDPLASKHDIVGYNYLIGKAEGDHERVPGRVIWQTESYPAAAFESWKAVHDHPYVIGDFVWTAIDYLGESGIGRNYYTGETPGEHYQGEHYPWHGAYCGDIDFTGWRKPISHYREILWHETPAMYMAVREPDGYRGEIHTTAWSVWPTWESWTWPGWEGRPVQVEVYSRYPSVRLYLNDELIGEKPTTEAEEFKAVFDVSYAPGILRCEASDAVCTLTTAGEPASIRLTPDRDSIGPDGLCFVTVEVLDASGNVCPEASNLLAFEVTGGSTLLAAGNADLTEGDTTLDSTHPAWKGRALAVLKGTASRGSSTLKVSADGLQGSTITVQNIH